MNLIKKSFFLVLILPLLAFSLHKYYISFTKIKYSEKSQSVQITSRIFIDDLQNALDTQYDIDSKLHTDNELKNTNDYIAKYIADKFSIVVNATKKEYIFLGKEYDNDEIILYLEVENVSSIESIEVKNKILMEIFDDQQNIIKLEINDKKKSFILTKKSNKDLLKFY